MDRFYTVRLSFPPAFYCEDDNYWLMDYLFNGTVLNEYKTYHCCIRNAELSWLDYWICFMYVDKQDLEDVVEIIKDLGIICDVEYCNDDKLNYKMFFKN